MPCARASPRSTTSTTSRASCASPTPLSLSPPLGGLLVLALTLSVRRSMQRGPVQEEERPRACPFLVPLPLPLEPRPDPFAFPRRSSTSPEHPPFRPPLRLCLVTGAATEAARQSVHLASPQVVPPRSAPIPSLLLPLSLLRVAIVSRPRCQLRNGSWGPGNGSWVDFVLDG